MNTHLTGLSGGRLRAAASSNKEQEQTLQRATAAEQRATAAALDSLAMATNALSEAERAQRAEVEAKRNLLQANEAKHSAFVAEMDALAKSNEARNEANRAQQAEAEAKRNLEMADDARLNAEYFARDATALIVLNAAEEGFGGNARSDSGLQSLLMTVAGFRMAKHSLQSPGLRASLARVQAEVARSAPLLSVRETKRAITSLALSPDGRSLLSVGEGGSVHLWDVQVGAFVGKPLNR